MATTASIAPTAPRALTPLARAPDAGAEGVGEAEAAEETPDLTTEAELGRATERDSIEEEAGGWAAELAPGVWDI